MVKLSPDSAWEFAETIKGLFGQLPIKRNATVQQVDQDGTIWVQLPGSSKITPIKSTGANVAPGDVVLTELRGTNLCITENRTDPAVGSNAAREIAQAITAPAIRAAEIAKGIADEARQVAEATGQHFWDDDNGAHVTDVTREEWETAVDDGFSDYDPSTKPYHNQLTNSLGILLRTALNNLVSITRSAIAFYDGTGNAASNIVARFGADGAQIGKTGAAHSVIDANGQRFYGGSNGNEQLANIGYGEGASQGGGTANAPYFTFGGRTYVYPFDESRPFVPGDICVYGGQHYCCKERTSGAWDATKWQVLSGTDSIGNLSVSVGYSSSRAHCSYSEGNRTVSDGESSHSEGLGGTMALGEGSHAEGFRTIARAPYAHSQNAGTIAAGMSQTAIGTYNVEDTNDDYALIIGNGTSDTARSNALMVDWDGYLYPCAEKMPDFVVEQGTSGMWTYRKWHSGIAECWGIYTASMAINTASTSYGGYRSVEYTATAYPFAFAAKPVVSALMSDNSQGAWVNNAQNENATAFKFYLSSGGALAAANRSVSIHATGRWK